MVVSMNIAAVNIRGHISLQINVLNFLGRCLEEGLLGHMVILSGNMCFKDNRSSMGVSLFGDGSFSPMKLT